MIGSKKNLNKKNEMINLIINYFKKAKDCNIKKE